jgi:hypothetical protein
MNDERNTSEDEAPFPGATDALAGDLENPTEPVKDDGFDEDEEGVLPPEPAVEEPQLEHANPGDGEAVVKDQLEEE